MNPDTATPKPAAQTETPYGCFDDAEEIASRRTWHNAASRARYVQRLKRNIDYYFSRSPAALAPSRIQRELLPDRKTYDAVLAWRANAVRIAEEGAPIAPVSAYMFGNSGLGKTRCAAELFYLETLDNTGCEWWAAPRLKMKLAELSRTPEALGEFIDELAAFEVVFIDDIGHGLSASFLENVRLILDAGAENFTSFVFTSNYSLPELARAGKEQGLGKQIAAVIRRIEETSALFHFRNQPRPRPNGKPEAAPCAN